MSDTKINRQRAMILAAEKKSRGARYRAYTKLSGPGWLQGAITLGGGSLAGSLYLGYHRRLRTDVAPAFDDDIRGRDVERHCLCDLVNGGAAL